MQTASLSMDTLAQQIALFGPHDDYVRIIENTLSVTINTRDSKIEIAGASENIIDCAIEVFESLKQLYRQDEPITTETVYRMLDIAQKGNLKDTLAAMEDVVVITYNGKPIRCKTMGQRQLINALRSDSVTLCIGPAGTGKTYLAVAQAVAEFKRGEIDRIIMSRPAIEAGEEHLGFLPGDLSQKVDPYLRPLYDALNDVLGVDQARKYQERGIIEIAPLAYMRGRTLSSARIIIDESQNASLQTLKMALTRLGEGSKMVLTGDVTQIDLPKASTSGLEKCASILKSVEGISIIRLSDRDVVRNKIVRDIIRAFDNDAKKAEHKNQQRQVRKSRIHSGKETHS